VEEAEAMRKTGLQRLDEKLSRASAKNEQLRQRGRERLQQEQDEHIERLQDTTGTERGRFEETRLTGKNQFESNQQAEWKTLETEWTDTLLSIYKTFAEANSAADRDFPATSTSIRIAIRSSNGAGACRATPGAAARTGLRA